jgi:hypothetical protein
MNVKISAILISILVTSGTAFAGALTFQAPSGKYSGGQWNQTEFKSPAKYVSANAKMEPALLIGGDDNPVGCIIPQSVAAEKGLSLGELEDRATPAKAKGRRSDENRGYHNSRNGIDQQLGVCLWR